MRFPTLVVAATVALYAECAASHAADLPTPQAPAAPYFLGTSPTPGWSFSVTPYGWLAGVTSKINTPIPGGGTATTDISVPFSDLLHDLRFFTMLAAEARYDRFSLLTDILYVNVGLNAGAARLTSISPGSGRIDIPVDLEASASTGVGVTVWTLAGGYTLAAGPWGHVDAIAGTRLLNVDVISNYNLNAAIVLPGRVIPFARSGTLSTNAGYWDAIAGATGQFNIPNSNFFVPYYLDVGTGELPLTWEAYAGVGYHAKWADLSLGYRYLDFQNNNSARVQNLTLGGPILAASFRF
jgi:hypothetical protein